MQVFIISAEYRDNPRYWVGTYFSDDILKARQYPTEQGAKHVVDFLRKRWPYMPEMTVLERA